MVGSLRDIELFVAAFEEGSFTAAADRECCTQSGVSQHIRKLETSIGAKLFMRTGGQIKPTPAGEVYYRSCVEILKRHAASSAAMLPFTDSLDGELTVGLMPTITRTILAPALVAFTEESPNVSLRVVEGYSGSLTRMVHAGELDFAIVPATNAPVGLRAVKFFQTPEVLVARRSHEAVSRNGSLLGRVGVKIIFPGSTHARHAALWEYIYGNEVDVSRSIELDSMHATLDLIARSDWVAILPLLLMRPAEDDVKFSISRLTEPSLDLSLVCLQRARQPLSRAGEVFLAKLAEECQSTLSIWN